MNWSSEGRPLERLRSQIEGLEADIRALEGRINAKAAERAASSARLKARLFLEMIFIPYVEGICDGLGLSPEDGVRSIIGNGVTLDRLAEENIQKLREFLSQPECRIAIAAAGPVARKGEEWMREKTDLLLEVMEDARPRLAEAIRSSPGGTEWLKTSLLGLRKLVFGN